MATVANRGKCFLCDRSFSKAGMTRHLQSCRENSGGGEAGSGRRPKRSRQGFHLAVEGRYRSQYWLHLEIAGDVPLAALDSFLRLTWLECCGHLSSFVIDGTTHFLEDMEEFADPDDGDMEVSLVQVLRPGMKFAHEYDFGSTTELNLRVVSQGDVSVDRKGIRLLARNDAPAIPCVKCDSPAANFCAECYWGDGGFFYCEGCSGHHTVQSPSHEGMFLPVVNSPRMGECAYTGSEEDVLVH